MHSNMYLKRTCLNASIMYLKRTCLAAGCVCDVLDAGRMGSAFAVVLFFVHVSHTVLSSVYLHTAAHRDAPGLDQHGLLHILVFSALSSLPFHHCY